jgi:hypothetical protein
MVIGLNGRDIYGFSNDDDWLWFWNNSFPIENVKFVPTRI